MRSRLRAIPAWGWLAAIVLGSFALRAWLARGMVAPFIMVDELIYAELAKSFAESGERLVRGVPTSGYSLLYPVLISPAYAVFDRLTDAYAAVKTINALAMSLSAVPAYLLARRVVSEPLSLLAAVLAVALPSLAYTGTVTTESLFYPLALVVVLLLARYLERPGWWRLAALGAAVAAAFLTRSQGVVFVPVVATAPLALAALRRSATIQRPFVPLYVVLGAAAGAVVAVQRLRGEPLRELLGAYSVVGEGGYEAGDVLRYWLWHAEELTLYAGIVPVAAFLLLLAGSRGLPARLQEHLAVTLASAVWGTLAVGTFASRFASDRVQDRYLFYLVPLLLVALLAWVALGAPRPGSVALGATLVALVLPLLFPYTRFINEPAKSDSLGLIPLWTINEHLVAGAYWATVGLAGAALVALFLLVPPRLALAVPLALLLLYALESRAVWSGPNGFVRAGAGALFQGIRGAPRDWVDRATPEGSEVAFLWSGRSDRFVVNQNEFFNRSVGDVLYSSGSTPGGIGETKVTIGRDDGLVRIDGGSVRVPYVVTDGTITPDGDALARDKGLGTTLWRVRNPLLSATRIGGLYPNDTWSGSTVTWAHRRCRPGTLAVSLSSDPSLFTRAQTVSAETTVRLGKRQTTSFAFARFGPADTAVLRIRVAPTNGRCVVRFRVRPTAVPAKVIPGNGDDRMLGAHFNAFTYPA